MRPANDGLAVEPGPVRPVVRAGRDDDGRRRISVVHRSSRRASGRRAARSNRRPRRPAARCGDAPHRPRGSRRRPGATRSAAPTPETAGRAAPNASSPCAGGGARSATATTRPARRRARGPAAAARAGSGSRSGQAGRPGADDDGIALLHRFRLRLREDARPYTGRRGLSSGREPRSVLRRQRLSGRHRHDRQPARRIRAAAVKLRTGLPISGRSIRLERP